MSESAAIELIDVSKAFGEKRVLTGVSLTVPTGAVVGLLGKNGAGKTTLLKCALGLFKPQRGEARVFGQPAWTLGASEKARLGYVPQTPLLYPWMRVGQIVDYTASFYPRWNHDYVDGLLRRWRLPRKDLVGPLSVGQQQRLAIVLALGHEPELLVLDEPAAALDPEARREFLNMLLEVAAGGRTILFSTHITSDLEHVAERIAIVQDGRIRLCEDLDALKDRVKRLHIHARSALPVEVSVPGMLHVERSAAEPNEMLLSVERASDALVDDLSQRWGAAVDVEPLNLEDIFLEVTRV